MKILCCFERRIFKSYENLKKKDYLISIQKPGEAYGKTLISIFSQNIDEFAKQVQTLESVHLLISNYIQAGLKNSAATRIFNLLVLKRTFQPEFPGALISWPKGSRDLGTLKAVVVRKKVQTLNFSSNWMNVLMQSVATLTVEKPGGGGEGVVGGYPGTFDRATPFLLSGTALFRNFLLIIYETKEIIQLIFNQYLEIGGALISIFSQNMDESKKHVETLESV